MFSLESRHVFTHVAARVAACAFTRAALYQLSLQEAILT